MYALLKSKILTFPISSINSHIGIISPFLTTLISSWEKEENSKIFSNSSTLNNGFDWE
jgi:hypothetical protein